MRILNKTNGIWMILIVLSFGLLQGAILLGLIDAFYEITLVTILINMILAIGLNVIIGFSGQFSLGHAGFMAIGAYATGILTKQFPNYGGMAAGIVVGGIIAGIVALIVGIPTLRLKGDYLAIATLGVAEIIRIIILNMGDLTNGAAGLSGIPYLSTWYIGFFLAVVVLIFAANYKYSSVGRATISVREDEIAAESLGIHTTRYKTIAFVMGAVTAAIAGSIHATYFSVISPDQFNFMKSIDILIIVVFGGIGSLTGSVIAATVLGVLNVFLQPFGSFRMILYAIALISIMIFKPSGLMGTKELNISSFIRKKDKSENKKREEKVR
ncbi:branched-chain amino acid ABC transporter permease [Lacticigenium naphthae]|uniref:branched-chain amino acid ABC transporter permease n=1 Tax=Lacticigenium naphthae TaxID=515351 RepID=UPI000414FA72|nr:branched-chain amino acid ABC transporter permease [Lacticigenium naphthae]